MNKDNSSLAPLIPTSLPQKSIKGLETKTTLKHNISTETFTDGDVIPQEAQDRNMANIDAANNKQRMELQIKYKILILLTCGIILGTVLPKNKDLPTPTMQYISSVIGYTYFLCWSISFYPQVILNHKRKNTTGLSPDFSVLNVVGFACYSIYVSFLFWSPKVRDEYQQRFNNGHDDEGSHSESDADPNVHIVPVQSNDVAFAIHAFVLSFVQVTQIVYYQERRRERNSVLSNITPMIHRSTRYFLLVSFLLCIIYATLVGYHVHGLIFLDYLYMLSSIKLTITIIKYIPQVLLNYQRKSTVGWNIWNVLLDFSGGLLSLLQLILDAVAMDDFTAITGNWIKFGLSFVSLFFDVSFIILVSF